MIYVVLGLLFGLLIPYIARRFEKFMPATMAYGIYRIIKPRKRVSLTKRRADEQYKKLMKEYVVYSIGWAIVSSCLTYLMLVVFGEKNVVWHLMFLWTMLLLTEIDKRMFLLPDILTIPLLILGFNYAIFSGQWVSYGDSALGALAGYFLPVISGLFLVWKNKDMFGGGDVKLLAAIGAWLGLEYLLYTIILSCAIFAVYAFVNKQREGAFGPAAVMAALIVVFLFM